MKMDSAAPTATAATAVMRDRGEDGLRPVREEEREQRDQSAETEGHERGAGRLEGLAERVGTDAELLPGVGLERSLRIGHHLAGDLGGELGGDAATLVDPDELPELPLGSAVDLLTLEFELALEQLGLSLHRDVLAGGHRERAAEKPGQARQLHHSHGRIRARHAEDQRDVRHEPVTDPEDGGSCAAPLDVAMVVVVDGGVTS